MANSKSIGITKSYFVAVALGVCLFWGFSIGIFSRAYAQMPDFPNPAADDNGHYAFAREVVPILLGRKPRGALEIRLLGDIAALKGRDFMVRLLMESKPFRVHWSNVLLDILQVQRGGPKEQSIECFNEPIVPIETYSLIGWHLTRQPYIPPEVNPFEGTVVKFNMKDVIISALKFDNLSSLMRVYLFPLAMQPGRESGVPEEVRRQSVGSTFTHLYLNRSLGCLGCHSEEHSTSGRPFTPGWVRTHPIPIGLDRSIFGLGPSENFVGFDDAEDFFNTYNIFPTNARARLVDANKVIPWNIHESCVKKREDFVGFTRSESSPDSEVNFAGITGPNKSVFDLEESLRNGLGGLVIPADPLPGLLPAPTPESAFAYQVAVSVVDQVWEAVVGRRLTIENYFPRNEDQRNALWTLTENVFLPDWSIKNLLTTILTSGYINRRAPSISLQSSAYVLPMIIDPWVERDPREPDDRFHDPDDPKLYHNGQGEIVRRHSPATLITSVASALDWPALLPFGRRYPSAQFMKEIGQYWSETERGTRAVDFQSLLVWETVHGRCQKPEGVTSDWIDRLVSEIRIYNADNTDRPLLLEDAIETLKDWLIQEATISATPAQEREGGGRAEISERRAILNILRDGITERISLASVTSSLASYQLEDKLRTICGVLLESPQFMLTGLSLNRPRVVPKLRVCNDADDCSYKQMCENYTRVFGTTLAIDFTCLDNDVVPGTPPPIPIICPPGVCVDISPRPCLIEAIPDPPRPGPIDFHGCMTTDIPRCDPRCEFLNPGRNLSLGTRRNLGLPCCRCNGPSLDLIRPASILAWLQGAKIVDTKDALVYRLGGNTIRPLRIGDRLEFGEVVILSPGSRFEADGNMGRFGLGEGIMPTVSERITRPIDWSLIKAVSVKDISSVEAILEKGANPHAIDKAGRSVLTLAAEIGQPDLLKILVQSGVDINLPDVRGITALKAAQLKKHSANEKLLKEMGAVEGRSRQIPRKSEMPSLIFVTGPSAKTAPPTAGKKYLTTLQALELYENGQTKGKTGIMK